MNYKLIHLPEVESTNTYAITMLAQNRPEEGSVVVTDFQTNGKGTEANTWESEKGKNLTFSLILYPTFAADQQFVLNKAISLGINDFLKSELHYYSITIKWPNDIYINDKKVCGILIQNSVLGNKLDYVIVGIGLNVNQTHFISNAPNPVSMKMTSGLEYNLEQMLYKLLQSISKRYDQVKAGKIKKIEFDYLNVLYRLMEWHDYFIKGIVIRAKITGTNDYGQLLLETESEKVVVCDHKEIKFIF